MVLTSPRPVPVSFAREGRDEQHMNANSKRERPLDKKCKMPSAGADLPRVLMERQLGLVPGKGRIPDIVVPLPQLVSGDLITGQIAEPRQKLANAQNSCCNIRYNRI